MIYQGSRFLAAVDYFHSKQTNNIILANATTAGQYVNSGQSIFHGFELEEKYYFKKNFSLMGSALYQNNHDENGNTDITPIPNFEAKAGISYESSGGFTVGLFDVYEGHVSGYAQSANPPPTAYHLVNAHFRWDLSKYLAPGSRTGLALVAHVDNLTNKSIWLPDWKDVPGGSTFADRGRTIYAGIEFSLKKD